MNTSQKLKEIEKALAWSGKPEREARTPIANFMDTLIRAVWDTGYSPKGFSAREMRSVETLLNFINGSASVEDLEDAYSIAINACWRRNLQTGNLVHLSQDECFVSAAVAAACKASVSAAFFKLLLLINCVHEGAEAEELKNRFVSDTYAWITGTRSTGSVFTLSSAVMNAIKK